MLGRSLGVGSCALLTALIPDGQFPEPLLSPAVVFVTLVALLGVSGIAAAIPAARVRGMEISAALRAAA